MRDIYDIINEESEQWLNEIGRPNSRIKTYDYTERGNGQYLVHVVEPEKNINTTFDVNVYNISSRDVKGFDISFKQSGHGYNEDTGMGIQFRILATVSKIVQENVERHHPDIITFQPIKTGRDHSGGNRRMKLYLAYVKGGAGDDYDSFIVGDDYSVIVENRNPSYELENGYQDQETIQDIITQLTKYGGYYQTDLQPTDPEYRKFYGSSGQFVKSGGRTEVTKSARKIVDWIFSEEDIEYVQGRNEENPYDVPAARPNTTSTGDAPIQRVNVSTPQTPTAMIGTFEYFLQTHIYGNEEYDVLEPYYETLKSINDFNELSDRASILVNNARTSADRDRLNAIIRAIDKINTKFEEYNRQHSTELSESHILNEAEKELSELIGLI